MSKQRAAGDDGHGEQTCSQSVRLVGWVMLIKCMLVALPCLNSDCQQQIVKQIVKQKIAYLLWYWWVRLRR